MWMKWEFKRLTILPVIEVEGMGENRCEIKNLLEFAIKIIEIGGNFKANVIAPNLNDDDKNFGIKVSFALIFPNEEDLIQFSKAIEARFE